MSQKTAIIIGAGPAGLTAAYELLQKTDIKPIVFEMSGDIGGIAKTVNYKGNRIDIGGHRFFSKSERVVQWWQNILPLQGAPSRDDILLDRKIPLNNNCERQPNLGVLKRAQTKDFNAIPRAQSPLNSADAQSFSTDPEKTDKVMLVRQRLSRIFFLRKFFDYPIAVNTNTFFNLGVWRLIKIFMSYVKVKFFPIKQEHSLEDFFINRFGKELYGTFFKDYTEKVWGVACDHIKPEWGAQRIKGLSISKALGHALKSFFSKDNSLSQKNVETSLIGQFTYPKLGPGQMWEEVARVIQEKGGEVHTRHRVVGIDLKGNGIKAMGIVNEVTGEQRRIQGDYIFSSMPVKDLIQAVSAEIPSGVRSAANGLVYRDFITVGILLKKLTIQNTTKMKSVNNIIPDNWIYIQEPDVQLCRLQVFNNWSPYMVKDSGTVWLGLEYMCDEGDDLWRQSDAALKKFAGEELEKIGIIHSEDILDATVLRVPKAYPAYFGSYDQFDEVRNFTDTIENLFLIGRNGMHRYNNQDHSMLTAMEAVNNIIEGKTTKANIWDVNAEKDYHEEHRMDES